MLLLTPRGAGGVAVLAAEPVEETRLLESLFSASGRALPPPVAGGPPRLCSLRFAGEEVDRVLVLRHPATGVLEVHAHGSEAVLAAVERHFGALGSGVPRARAAHSAAADLVRRALSEPQLALGLEQAAWDFEAFLRELEALPPASRGEQVDAALRRSEVALALATPHRVVVCGRQNAGKSTLINRLLFRERLLTGEQPGLTRDPVCEITCLSGYPYELIDTAGEGPVAEGPDRLALEAGRRHRQDADRLLVVDGSVGPREEDRVLCDARTLVLRSKADLSQATWPDDVPCHGAVSCLDPGSAAEVRAVVGVLLRERRGLPPAGPVGGPAALDNSQVEALLRMRAPPA